jgi:hypothetical protein
VLESSKAAVISWATIDSVARELSACSRVWSACRPPRSTNVTHDRQGRSPRPSLIVEQELAMRYVALWLLGVPVVGIVGLKVLGLI